MRAEADATVRSIELCSEGTPNMAQITRDLKLGFKLDAAWGLEQLSGCRVPAGQGTRPTHLVVRFSTRLRQAVALALVSSTVGNPTVLEKARLLGKDCFARATTCAIHKIFTVEEFRRKGHARQLVQALEMPAGFPGKRWVFAEAYQSSSTKKGECTVSTLWRRLGFRQCTGTV